MFVIYAAGRSLRILEDLKAMNTAHLGNSFSMTTRWNHNP